MDVEAEQGAGAALQEVRERLAALQPQPMGDARGLQRVIAFEPQQRIEMRGAGRIAIGDGHDVERAPPGRWPGRRSAPRRRSGGSARRAPRWCRRAAPDDSSAHFRTCGWLRMVACRVPASTGSAAAAFCAASRILVQTGSTERGSAAFFATALSIWRSPPAGRSCSRRADRYASHRQFYVGRATGAIHAEQPGLPARRSAARTLPPFCWM